MDRSNEPSTSVSFGQIIALKVKVEGHSYAWLGREMGMDRQTIGTRLTGDTMWKLDEAVRACELLSLDVGEVMEAVIHGTAISITPSDVQVRRTGCLTGI